MSLIVQKYGGSSVGNLDRIHHVAKKIMEAKYQGHDVVVVVSAMYGETDRLLRLASALTVEPHPRELDVLISTGEQVSMALLSMALNANQCPARSFTGFQIGIQTDSAYNNARILGIKTQLIRQELAQKNIVVIAGFQGINQSGDITTLGRGGSDTTAVALAAALKAKECQIYTDVDGVYTTDPHFLPEAKILAQISFQEMLEMASLGSKVLQIRSVELASQYKIPVRVLSTFSDGPGSLVTFEDQIMQKRVVSGIAFSKEEAIIFLSGIPYQVGMEGKIIEEVSDAGIEIDMIAQNVKPNGNLDFACTVNRRDHHKATRIIKELAKDFGNISVQSNPKVAKLSLVGLGIRSQPGVARTLFKTLGEAGIHLQMIATSEIKISVIFDEAHLENGVKAVHRAFELDKIPALMEQIHID